MRRGKKKANSVQFQIIGKMKNKKNVQVDWGRGAARKMQKV